MTALLKNCTAHIIQYCQTPMMMLRHIFHNMLVLQNPILLPLQPGFAPLAYALNFVFLLQQVPYQPDRGNLFVHLFVPTENSSSIVIKSTAFACAMSYSLSRFAVNFSSFSICVLVLLKLPFGTLSIAETTFPLFFLHVFLCLL